MGYTYEGRGLVIEIWELEDFVTSCNETLGEDYDDIEDIENEGWIGDWCSQDNLDSAYLDGEELECPACLVIMKDRESGYGHADLEALADVLETTPEDLIEEHEGDLFVECWQ